MIEQDIKILDYFVDNRLLALSFLKNNHKPKDKISLDERNPIYLLSVIKVTKNSRFLDLLWDYNEDNPFAAKNIKGTKLQIDFGKYAEVPEFIIIEIKCIMHYIMLNPLIFKAGGKNKKNNGKLKANTVITQMESGLRYFNHVFQKLNNDYGNEFLNEKFQTITNIPESYFHEGATDFPFTFDAAMKRFFYYLKHPFTSKIIDASIDINFDKCEWLKVSKGRNTDSKKQVFSNNVFEKLVQHSSSMITEFLELMGEEITDVVSVKYQNIDDRKYQSLNITKEIIEDYSVRRLNAKGHSETVIREHFQIQSSYFQGNGKMKNNSVLAAEFRKKHQIAQDDIRKYINEVYYACCYVVAQYTGMRPSELSEIRISQCLVIEGDTTLIRSDVKKHRESYNLFDDKWVAIPIIVDAIKAASFISRLKQNDYLFSNMDTVKAGEPETNMSSGVEQMNNLLSVVYDEATVKGINFNQYMTRHTLAYQLYRADLGLPFISHQLKHVVDSVDKYTSIGGISDVTLSYGEIADHLADDSVKGKRTIRKQAEIEYIENTMNPDSTYLGGKGTEHKERLKKAFEGYMAAGYNKEDIYAAMADQGMAVINVGTGFCYGGKMEDFDESIPCIGSLRCNPIRCSNAIVTKAHASKWREVYVSNKALLNQEGYEEHETQILAAMNEAKGVLEHLGEDVII
jgi:integrase